MQLISGRRFQHSYLAQFTVITLVEVLATISTHPHHISTAILLYLRLAHRSLQQTWGLIFTIKVGSLGL